MHNISNNLTQVRHCINESAISSGRNSSSVTLLAVSKTKPIEAIEEAFAAGQRDFGENYLQESLEKVDKLQHLPIIWHYIGAIQSNKAKLISEHFSWVHTVDRVKVARFLSQYRPIGAEPLHVCLQVNVDGEESKGGCLKADVLALAQAVAVLPNIRLRGLMAIPRPDSGGRAFEVLSDLKEEINQKLGLSLDTLSMGMSKDLDLAISAGATIVRVGTAIFGKRDSAY